MSCEDTGETPFIRQYKALKREAPLGSVLLVRLGDFYEAFGDDAVMIAPRFGSTLVRRGGYPMTGVPSHSLDARIRNRFCNGVVFAIAEEAEDPMTAKGGLVRREIVRIVNGGEQT